MGKAQRPRGVDIRDLTDGERAGAHNARCVRNKGDADRNDDVRQGGAEHRDHGKRDDDRRKGDHDVDDPLHDEVDAPAEISTGDAEDETRRCAGEGGDEADEKRRSCPVNDAGQQVAAELIRAQPVCCIGRQQHVGKGDDFRIVRGEQPGCDRRHHHDGDQKRAERGERLLAKEAECGVIPGTPAEEVLLRFLRYGHCALSISDGLCRHLYHSNTREPPR